MTTQIASRPRVGSVLLYAVLIGSLAVGFVAGQVAPDLLAVISAPRVIPAADLPALTTADDYATRHAATGADTTLRLTDDDDWALRHAGATGLGPDDDYGLRHRTPGGR